jgi:thymidylate synthase (FAD)
MLFYTPPAEVLQKQSRSNNQGRSGEALPAERRAEAEHRWAEQRRLARDTYEWLTSEDVARELARIDLPLSTYTQWYWKIDLHNLLHFLTLRVDPHAQWEIQEYGRIMAGMLKRVAPLSYEAWIDYDVCGAPLSRMEIGALSQLVESDGAGGLRGRGGGVSREGLVAAGLSGREADELARKLEPRPAPDFELDLAQARAPEHFAERFAAAVPKTDRPPPEG